MMIKNHIFRKKHWKIRNQDVLKPGYLGLCVYHKDTIHIPIEGDTRDELDVIIHESLHAACPYLNEDEVNETATDIAKLLWRLKWRKEFT